MQISTNVGRLGSLFAPSICLINTAFLPTISDSFSDVTRFSLRAVFILFPNAFLFIY
nr:MAG TPA: hypothetical protein [Caudoviricetes sp.]